MKISKTLFYFSLLLFVLYIIQWWLLFYYFTDVPEYIADTSIKISGLILALTIIPTLYFFLKRTIAGQPSISVLQLTILGILLAIVTEVLFQVVRQSVADTSLDQKLEESTKAIAVAAFGIGILSFMIAFRLKYKKSYWNTIILIGFFALIYVLKEYTTLFQK